MAHVQKPSSLEKISDDAFMLHFTSDEEFLSGLDEALSLVDKYTIHYQ